MSGSGDGEDKQKGIPEEKEGLRSRFPASNSLQVNVDTETGSANSSFIEEQIVIEDDENNDDDNDDDDEYAYSDDFEKSDDDDGGNNAEGNRQELLQFPIIRERNPNPVLPKTVTCLETDWGSKVYVVGTSHFSLESQEDVAKTIQTIQPDIVMVELCNGRVNILQLDEEKLMEDAKNINMDKIIYSIKQSGVLQGIMHILFLSLSAHCTRELGMAPGGEFRRAFKEAKKIEGCRLQLGDRPINVTLQRALGSLSIWQKIRLAWHLIMGKEPISKEDVEKLKQKDLLEELLSELTGEFPALSKVFVQERDFFLAHCLKHAAQPIPHPQGQNGVISPVVVGVVGIGHVEGIKRNWTHEEYTIKEVMTLPKKSMLGTVVKTGFRLSLLGLLSYGGYKVFKLVLPLIR